MDYILNKINEYVGREKTDLLKLVNYYLKKNYFDRKFDYFYYVLAFVNKCLVINKIYKYLVFQLIILQKLVF